MSSTVMHYGYRIVGGVHEARRLVDHAAAFRAYCECDPRANTESEAYLSAFTFGSEFRERARPDGTVDTRGFVGRCHSRWVWFDLDRQDDLELALKDSRCLAAYLLDRYRQFDEDDLLLFFSGAKGFHVGWPTSAWGPSPGFEFAATCREFARLHAEGAGIKIDLGVYDRVRAFRAPNSRHPKSGLFKRQFGWKEFFHSDLDALLRAAQSPAPFEMKDPNSFCAIALEDWEAVTRAVERERTMKTEYRSRTTNNPRLNQGTLAFIRGAVPEVGDRHRVLFSCAANLGELGASASLAWELLQETALDSGLSPKEVKRQIECGLAHRSPTEEPR
jgi:hypothetical protein